MRRQLRSSLTAIWFTLAFGITPANAGDMNVRLDKASEMILIIEKEGTLDQALNMVFMSAPEANRAELRQLIDGYLDRKALYAEWGRIAADIFTVEEMDALISFYSTPVGRSILKKRLQMNQKTRMSERSPFWPASAGVIESMGRKSYSKVHLSATKLTILLNKSQ